jgi:hypothetical protein
MRRDESYKGHAIIAETSAIANRYGWSYQIDGGVMRESRDRPLRSERVVLGKAVAEAKAEIDRTLTEEEARAAVEELRNRGAVDTLLYLNTIRENRDLANEPEYRTRFNGYYGLRQRSQEFYHAFYAALLDAVNAPERATLAGLLQEIFNACRERHLVFCSKLLATSRDDAVVFDGNVAEYFGVTAGPLPPVNWVNVAIQRYNDVDTHIARFLTAPEWPRMRAMFDATFPQARHLPDIRKADLIIWAHVGLQRP